MYLKKEDVLRVLNKLAHEPWQEHEGEDYYIGISEAIGEVYCMQTIGEKSISSKHLHEIIGRAITEIINDNLYKHDDQYYRDGIDEGVNRVIKIILEYTE